MIKEWIEEYNPKDQQEALAALREVMQEIALAGLQRGRFFEKAAFYGGSAQRIFYGLNRFSEDLDFSLLETSPDFSLVPYFPYIIDEFKTSGLKIDIKEKIKNKPTHIDSAFLKSDTLWYELLLKESIPGISFMGSPQIKIKIEVDKKPPPGFKTEEKLLLRPFSLYVKCFSLPDLFSGKIYALQFRNWIHRVKGRDWYDMEWYIQKKVPLHLSHFLLRANNSGDWQDETISTMQLKDILY